MSGRSVARDLHTVNSGGEKIKKNCAGGLQFNPLDVTKKNSKERNTDGNGKLRLTLTQNPLLFRKQNLQQLMNHKQSCGMFMTVCL